MSTANFAELYYRLARQVTTAGAVALDNLSAGFFGQIGVSASTPRAAAAAALQSVGDQMLQALVFHSDHFELSEQFDATSGYEKSVSSLSWSYASFLPAVRARTPSESPCTHARPDPPDKQEGQPAALRDLALADRGGSPRCVVTACHRHPSG